MSFNFLRPTAIAKAAQFFSGLFYSGQFSTAPTPAPAPLEDRELYEALQATVVGITGLDGDLVRPRWQPEPSLLPPAATCWIAIGVTDRDADTFPWQGMLVDGVNYQLRRNEEFTLFCTVYDLGYSGQADGVAAELRDGIMIPQNLEALAASEIYLVSDADLAVAPVLFKQRWMYGVDLRIRFRRQITRNYAVGTVLQGVATLYTDDGQPPRAITAKQASAVETAVILAEDGSVLTADDGSSLRADP